MWINNNNTVYNADQFLMIYQRGTKIIGCESLSSEVTLGEFWTVNEATDIFRSIKRSLVDDTRMIYIHNTRDGMKCLKKKKEKPVPVVPKEGTIYKDEESPDIPKPISTKTVKELAKMYLKEEPKTKPLPLNKKPPKGPSFFG